MTPDLDRTMEVVRRELKRYGCMIPSGQGGGVLATIMPGELEGHFRVDPQGNGSWRIWSTLEGRDIYVTGPVAANALAALAGETLLETRRKYCAGNGHPVPSPLPPPAVRARRKDQLAEEVMASLTGGTLPSVGNKGFDVLAPDGRRIQVKSSVRNAKSGLISTLQFKTKPGYLDHDELVYVEFSNENYPVRAWSIASDLFRSLVLDDGKTHHVEPLLQARGSDITEAFIAAYDAMFM